MVKTDQVKNALTELYKNLPYATLIVRELEGVNHDGSRGKF